MNYKEALNYILSKPRGKNESGLGEMRYLLEQLGNPHSKLKFVHVAGTNGKGSVNVMTANVLKEAGYKVGMNISPYVVEFCERIQINNKYIPQEELAALVEQAKPIVEQMEQNGKTIVQFELVTALALTYFAKENCDIVCLEVGIGGVLDSTNVVETTVVSTIASISFDHTELLGNTLTEIAYQKGGIIKQNTPAVFYPALAEEAKTELERLAAEKNAPYTFPDLEKLKVVDETIHFSEFLYKGQHYTVPFAGLHQVYNALTVIETCNTLQKLGWNISQQHIESGMKGARIPARGEIMHLEPTVIFDGSHNPEGIEALCNLVDKFPFEKKTAILSMKKGKDSEHSLQRLSESFDKLYLTEFSGGISQKAENLQKTAKKYFTNCEELQDPAQFYREIVRGKKRGELFVFCGSLYFISEIRAKVKKD